MTSDIIDALAGVANGSAVDAARRARPQARENSQASYRALFVSADQTGVTQRERLAVASFVAALHGVPAARQHYRELLVDAGGTELAVLIDQQAEYAAASGPYGRFPATADLRAEDQPGSAFAIESAAAAVLGSRLTSALEHAHLLVFRPRESSPQALAALLDAGWSTPEVVTLSQLVAFLTYQLRVVHGLNVLEGDQR